MDDNYKDNYNDNYISVQQIITIDCSESDSDDIVPLSLSLLLRCGLYSQLERLLKLYSCR